MMIKAGFVLLSIAFGCIATPTPEGDLSHLFVNADVNSRIVGGSVAADGSHPHMAALSSGLLIRNFLCGGSIVSSRSILTAAHCIDAVYSFGSLTSSLRVTIGTNRWNQGGQQLSLSGNATHPNYVANIIKNDIGLLFTSSAIVFTNRVAPIPVSFDYVLAGVPARAAGWGRTSTNAALSAQLLELVVSTFDEQQCIELVARRAVELNIRNVPAVQPHIEICAFLQSGSGTCRGDSGSALVRVDTGAQIGVVSWGLPCANGAPDMFARVSAFQFWYQQNIRL